MTTRSRRSRRGWAASRGRCANWRTSSTSTTGCWGWRRRDAEKAARERERRECEEAERQARRLDALAGQEERLWREVELAVASRLPKRYDEAVSSLKDLRELAGRAKAEAPFLARLRAL